MTRPQRRVELLTKPGCGLCDEMKEVLARVALDLGVSWRAVDISQDAGLTESYGNDIPVVRVDGTVWFQHRVSEAELRSKFSQL